ncbi:MAG: RyR domain-containing protein [Acidobacteriaceae bacterium]
MLNQKLSAVDVARTCHEVNRAYCKSLGDDSQPAWRNAPEWQKQSALNGVVFHMEHPDAGAAATHNSWLKEKELSGWKYGPVKNPDTKEHPCFVPYDQLPPEQQAKDALFIAVVHALLMEG